MMAVLDESQDGCQDGSDNEGSNEGASEDRSVGAVSVSSMDAKRATSEVCASLDITVFWANRSDADDGVWRRSGRDDRLEIVGDAPRECDSHEAAM